MRYFIIGVLAVATALGVGAYASKAEEPIVLEQSAEVAQKAEEAAKKAAEDKKSSGKQKKMELSVYEPDLEEITFTDDAGKKHIFQVEIAEKPSEVQKGLMFRRELDEDKGMLFIFSRSAERNFWMKNTYIPLDMFFIKDDGTIHHIHENAVPQDTTLIPSNGPVRYVLEMNAGTAEKYGIEAGDKFAYKLFVNKLAE